MAKWIWNIKNSKYFIDKINNIGNSDYLREYLDFINFDKLNLQTKSFLKLIKIMILHSLFFFYLL